mmetsp:Transcript_127753/g.361606  ORF Transcript_127753/g.361606 Transcript_127753/m.361606 type:complete len:230 (+) Transcript_127753:1003-1692(+)
MQVQRHARGLARAGVGDGELADVGAGAFRDQAVSGVPALQPGLAARLRTDVAAVAEEPNPVAVRPADDDGARLQQAEGHGGAALAAPYGDGAAGRDLPLGLSCDGPLAARADGLPARHGPDAPVHRVDGQPQLVALAVAPLRRRRDPVLRGHAGAREPQRGGRGLALAGRGDRELVHLRAGAVGDLQVGGRELLQPGPLLDLDVAPPLLGGKPVSILQAEDDLALLHGA